MILQKAVEDADSTDTAAIKAALDNMDVLTFFGHTKFDTTAEAHGLQIGHSMVYIQWQKDADGNLVKQVIWPEEGATAETGTLPDSAPHIPVKIPNVSLASDIIENMTRGVPTRSEMSWKLPTATTIARSFKNALQSWPVVWLKSTAVPSQKPK